jgi:hypothetical protein
MAQTPFFDRRTSPTSSRTDRPQNDIFRIIYLRLAVGRNRLGGAAICRMRMKIGRLPAAPAQAETPRMGKIRAASPHWVPDNVRQRHPTDSATKYCARGRVAGMGRIIASQQNSQTGAEFRRKVDKWRRVQVTTGHDLLDQQQVLHRSHSVCSAHLAAI